MTNITLRAPAVLGRTAFDQLFEQFFQDPRPLRNVASAAFVHSSFHVPLSAHAAGGPFCCLRQGGFLWRSLWPGGSLLCARSPPYVLSYVLLLVQMAGGGPLMRLFFISVCYL